MNCPACKQPMIVLEVEQIEVDYCSACEGIWLDAGELELLLDDAAQAHLLLQSFTFAHTPEKKRKCPICLNKMDQVNTGQADTGAELLDRCPRNHGLWFDRGELQNLLQKAHFDDQGRVRRLLGSLFCEKCEYPESPA